MIVDEVNSRRNDRRRNDFRRNEREPPGTRKSREIQRETSISKRQTHCKAYSERRFNLKLKIFRRREVQQLSESDAKIRLQACMRLKQRMTVDKIERTWFSDEQIFTVQIPTNTQSDHVYARVLKNNSDTWNC